MTKERGFDLQDRLIGSAVRIIKLSEALPETDWAGLDGRVADWHRIDFLNRYLIEVRKACEENIPVKRLFPMAVYGQL
jgi:hypothetical protein